MPKQRAQRTGVRCPVVCPLSAHAAGQPAFACTLSGREMEENILKQNLKRIVSAMLLLALAVSLLAGCSGSSSSTPAAPASTAGSTASDAGGEIGRAHV